jgi:hypothetical protein
MNIPSSGMHEPIDEEENKREATLQSEEVS